MNTSQIDDAGVARRQFNMPMDHAAILKSLPGRDPLRRAAPLDRISIGLLAIALLLGACSRDGDEQQSRQAQPQESPFFRGCGNSIAGDRNRSITDFHADQGRKGEILRLSFYVVDPDLPPAIKGNPGTFYIAVRVGEVGVGKVRHNRHDPTDPKRYPEMSEDEQLAWNLVIFRGEAIVYDQVRDFAVTSDDDLPTRELVFLEGKWAIRAIVPDRKVPMALQYGEQARDGLRRLLEVQHGCTSNAAGAP